MRTVPTFTINPQRNSQGAFSAPFSVSAADALTAAKIAARLIHRDRLIGAAKHDTDEFVAVLRSADGSTEVIGKPFVVKEIVLAPTR